MSNKTINGITREIAAERRAQVQRWGQQDHASSYSDLDRKRAEKNANRWKEINDARVQADRLTWDGILLEEVWEALAEKDPEARRAELIQVAAVAAAEVEAIDRVLLAQRASETPEPEAVEEQPELPLCDQTGELCVEGCETPCTVVDLTPEAE